MAHTKNNRRLLLITSLALPLLLLLYLATVSHAQIDPKRPQLVGSSNLGFTGASTSDDLVVFDMDTGTADPTTIDLLPEGNYPYDATLNPDRTQVWIPGASGEGLVVIDAITPTIVQRIPNLGDYPVDVVFSEHGEFAYVSSRNTADDIQIIDTNTYTVVGSIPIPDYYLGMGKMRTNPCNGELYGVNWYDDRFFVINPISQTVTTDMTLGDSLWDLTIDPTATTLYIADRGTPDAVHVLDIATLTTITTIPVGTDPWSIDITPDGRYVLTANEDSHDVSVIDTASNTVTTTIFLAANADPRDIDINAEGTLAYVTTGDIGSPDGVYVIDLATFQVIDTIFSPAGGGSNTNVIAVAPDFASLDPIASFTSTSPVQIGMPIEFFDTTANNPTTWFWDFGDGVGTSTLQNPVYTYANLGTYTVTLTTDNACGTGMVQDQVIVALPAPDLAIGKTAPATADPQTPITYTLTVANSGLLSATNLIISDALPIGASYISGGTLNDDTVNWQIPILPANDTVSVQFIVTATDTITNDTYAVTADGGYSAAGTEPIVTVITAVPQLHITLDGPTTADPGVPITYTLTVSNSSFGLATNLLITDVLPIGANYLNGGTLVNDTVQWHIPSLAHNTAVSVQFAVTATATITNDTYAVTADDGHNAVGIEPVVTVITAVPQLHITLDGPQTADPGAPITYTLTVSNSSFGLATNLLITDVLPVGANYLSGGTLISDTMQWHIPSLAHNTAVSVQFAVTATATITNSDYAVTADGGFAAIGLQPVTTIILSEPPPKFTLLYLPFVLKP